MNFISASVLLKLFIRIHLPIVRESEPAEFFRIPYFCGRWLVLIIGCKNFLSLNLYVIRMSLSTVFVLLHLDPRTLLATWDVLKENMFLEISKNSQENACAKVSFLIKLQAWGTPFLQNISGRLPLFPLTYYLNNF